MALILKNKKFDSGLNLTDVYCKILNLSCNKENIIFKVGFYANKDARENNMITLKDENYSCSHCTTETSFNSIKQGYEYLKTLDEYKNAIDDLSY